MSDNHHHLLDVTFIGAAWVSFLHWLPEAMSNATAFMSLIYLCVRLYETPTARKALRRMRTWLSD